MNFSQDEIEWKLFEFAEGNLHGDEFEFWGKAIQEDSNIRHQYQKLCGTYLTDNFTQINLTEHPTPQSPVARWGDNLRFPNKYKLKKSTHSLAKAAPKTGIVQTISATGGIWGNHQILRAVSIAAAFAILGLSFWVFQLPSNSIVPGSTSETNPKTKQFAEKNATPTGISQSHNHYQKPSSGSTIESSKVPSTQKRWVHNGTINLTNHTSPQNEILPGKVHPLITATENYRSKSSRIEPTNAIPSMASNYAANTNSELQTGKPLSADLQQVPAVEETIIKLVNTRPKSNAEKRKYLAYNVKEMMRKGQLPSIKIQPNNEPKAGLLPSFNLELDVNQVPIYQTSNK